MSEVKCLNPWDPQSKRQYRIDGVYATLNAGQAIGGQAHGICYAIEGNVVDRVSAKNGKVISFSVTTLASCRCIVAFSVCIETIC